MSAPVKILLDCDPGVDDALTLLHLAPLIASGEVDLVAVGTVHGKVAPDVGALNALRVLERAGLRDIPVAVGAGRPMAQPAAFASEWHGTDGLGGTRLPEPAGRPAEISAPDQIVRLARRHLGELTLQAIGPLTNLGIALLLEPSLPELFREVVIMGGAFDHPGNITGHAEANIWHDPEAAELVLGAGWPITLVPLDVTHAAALDGRVARPARRRRGRDRAVRDPCPGVLRRRLPPVAGRTRRRDPRRARRHAGHRPVAR